MAYPQKVFWESIYSALQTFVDYIKFSKVFVIQMNHTLLLDYRYYICWVNIE